MKHLSLSLCAILLAGCASGPTHTMDDHRNILNEQLSNAERFLKESAAENGQRIELVKTYSGSLANRATEKFAVPTENGTEYVFAGVCDYDCGDIDMAAFNGNDAMIDNDELDDDIPILNFEADNTGTHSIEVKMYQCINEPCLFKIHQYKIVN